MSKYERKDRLYRQAKEEGYRGRAAYKLIELEQKHKLLGPGARVLDLGSYPGGWLQVALEKVGASGVVLGVDLKELEPVTLGEAQATILLGDVYDEAVQAEIIKHAGGKLDVVLSDMSPKLSGIRFQDALRSAALVEMALFLCGRLLKPGGSFVAKLFPGSESDELVREYRPYFDRLTREVLKSTRKSSKEFYLVGKGFRAMQEPGSSDGDTGNNNTGASA